MRILNIGSINIDHVYRVPHFVAPGETLASAAYARFAGGKGFNQSVALARAGMGVSQVGRIGPEGRWLKAELVAEAVDANGIMVGKSPTGHALIQVCPSGENAILIHGGANDELAEADVAKAIARVAADDVVLLQNETNAVAVALRCAADRGLRVAFNPAPMSPLVKAYPLGGVDLLLLNETEAAALTGEADEARMLTVACRLAPRATVVVTLGARGAVAAVGARRFTQPAVAVQAVDTTAAGDTFTGYFLAEWLKSGNVPGALQVACRAAAICVTRRGAAESIPYAAELGAQG